MQLGAMNHPAKDVVEEIRWIAEHGFDYIDLTLEPPAADPRTLELSRVATALEKYELPVVAHTAYYLPYATPFATIRRACLEELSVAVKVAGKLGARLVTVHFCRPPKFFSEEDVFAWHREILAPLCDLAEQCGTVIAVEQSPFPQCRQIDILERLLTELPGLRFHLDAGHARLEPQGDLWEEYLTRLGRFLVHVHLSENDGTCDQHLPLGAVPGQFWQWPRRIAQLQSLPYDGTITLEVFAPEPDYLLLSRDLVRRWWNEAGNENSAA